MPSSRLIAPGAAALAVLALAATGCADDTDRSAATVGDQTLSADDLIDEVETIAGNDELVDGMGLQAAGEMRGSYTRDFVDQVLERRVVFMIYDQLAADEGIEVTDSERSQAERYWADGDTEFGPAYGSFPESYRDQLVDEVATAIAVEDQLGNDGQAAFTELVQEVEIAPRFGAWDADAFLANSGSAVLPPDGPLWVSPEDRAEAEESADDAVVGGR